MTRPKADSDGWITDPIARDRVVAKTVVEGIRQIVRELRAIRDELGETRALREENRELRTEVHDLWLAHYAQGGGAVPKPKSQWPACEVEYCALPDGHPGAHRGSVRSA